MKPLPIFLAPLQGYTEAAYRNAHAACFGGVDTYYTPFVRVEKGGFRSKDLRDIAPENNHVPHLVPQLIASSAAVAEQILPLFIERNYRQVDINLGCPFPLLAARHNGAGILPYPAEVRELLSVVRRHSQIEFSVKMRLGWEDPAECLRLAPLLNEVPLRHVTVHPRLGRQQYKGSVDLRGLASFMQVCRHPVVYNGDICRVEDIYRVQEQFPTLAAVMVGRGLLADPALAWEYREGRTLSEDRRRQQLQAMHEAVYHSYTKQIEGGEAQLLGKMKTFWEYLLPLGDKKALKAIRKSSSLQKYRAAVAALFDAR